MATVTYCLLVTSSGLCTEKFQWDDDYTYTPASGYSLAPNSDGEVGWTWNGTTWSNPTSGDKPAALAGSTQFVLLDLDNQFGDLTEKTVPAAADYLLLEDSAASYAKKLVKSQNVIQVFNLTAKTTLATDDTFFISDSAASNVNKKVKFTAIKNAISIHFLATADASASATLDFTAFDNATYDGYLFVLANVTPATDNVNLLMRTSTNGGTSYDSGASDYLHAAMGYESAGSSRDSGGAGSAIPVTRDINNFRVGNAAGEDGVSGTVTITGAQLTKQVRVTGQVGYTTVSAAELHTTFSATRSTQADVDAVRFLFSSGNIASGTITMYGYRNA